jgi:WhiB family redox-sensing transcriptional regulator
MSYSSTEWMDSGLCRETDPTLFHTETRQSAPMTRKAKKVCDKCPVRSECLAWAMKNAVEDNQIYGGMSRRERMERMALRKAVRAAR